MKIHLIRTPGWPDYLYFKPADEESAFHAAGMLVRYRYNVYTDGIRLAMALKWKHEAGPEDDIRILDYGEKPRAVILSAYPGCNMPATYAGPRHMILDLPIAQAAIRRYGCYTALAPYSDGKERCPILNYFALEPNGSTNTFTYPHPDVYEWRVYSNEYGWQNTLYWEPWDTSAKLFTHDLRTILGIKA